MSSKPWYAWYVGDARAKMAGQVPQIKAQALSSKASASFASKAATSA